MSSVLIHPKIGGIVGSQISGFSVILGRFVEDEKRVRLGYGSEGCGYVVEVDMTSVPVGRVGIANAELSPDESMNIKHFILCAYGEWILSLIHI